MSDHIQFDQPESWQTGQFDPSNSDDGQVDIWEDEPEGQVAEETPEDSPEMEAPGWFSEPDEIDMAIDVVADVIGEQADLEFDQMAHEIDLERGEFGDDMMDEILLEAPEETEINAEDIELGENTEETGDSGDDFDASDGDGE